MTTQAPTPHRWYCDCEHIKDDWTADRIEVVRASNYEVSEAKLREARELLKQSCDRFTHIAEYWNRNENDRATSDALCNMIEEAEAGESAIDAFLASTDTGERDDG